MVNIVHIDNISNLINNIVFFTLKIPYLNHNSEYKDKKNNEFSKLGKLIYSKKTLVNFKGKSHE